LDRVAPAVAARTRSEEVMRATIGAARDMRGVLAAAQTRSAYVSVFEVLHPKHIETMLRSLDVWADTPAVTNPVLKLIVELCLQRGGRIAFGSNSPNGILLFRAASQAVCTFGSRLLPYQPPRDDAYRLKNKGIMLCASLMNRCLDGAFVNFGVFGLYGDRAADSALDMLFNLIATVPPSELMAFPKLATQVMLFLQLVCRSHMDILTAQPPARFAHFCTVLREGLDNVDSEVSLQAATAWDHITSTFVRNARKDAPSAAALRMQVQAQPGLFEHLMKMLFQIIVFNESSAQWSVMRALLPAILAAEATRKDVSAPLPRPPSRGRLSQPPVPFPPQVLEVYKADLVSSQPASLQPRIGEEFNKLCADVTRSLDMANRDRFAQRLSFFRTTVREFAAV